ncbi:hypothetical protein [Halomonas salipaludis]|uniref:Uncharacterized protein n=1 Tax=Halomonas salipaludis TaxID=2032625 RepID=A0A2A2F1D5_9GAMM|nr:hypothetical protein [Halomonas salipaludis]PAU79431.1 hypothetical protein CK498_03435 [Halomonas salipaludis]
MTNIQTLTLLPQDQLGLINSIEVQAVLRYRRLALRFITFSTVLSRQMAEYGIACEQRITSLRDAAESLGLGACVGVLDVRRLQEPAQEPQDRFFIIDEAIVDQELQRALATAFETHSVARQLLGANGTPELERPLWEYVQHKQFEVNALMHCCTRQLQHA